LTFRYRRRVQFAETDLAGIVHFSCYFKYMEEAEHALWREAGLSIAGDDLHWPRVAASCDYKAPLRFEDEIDVTVVANVERRRIHYRFDIAHGSTSVANGTIMSVCARINEAGALKTVEVPDSVMEKLRAVLR
jgi:acyl-CoA thioester hydrolase